MTLRICFDLDGTICANKKAGETYEDVLPLPGAVETLQEFKSRGYYIVIHTARGMATCENNLGAVMKKNGKLTIDWLNKHNIPYDEILFGKPHVDLFLDDKGMRFTDWDKARTDILEFERKKGEAR